ncbi:MAG: hypothetical protein O7C74_02560 [Acidobacteria bacterium]|nr:hypothetical protein [Acidobacteriota bacterium]
MPIPREFWRDWRAPMLAAFVAVAAALPGLRFPFLSDDWALIEAVSTGLTHATPYGDFRPLYMSTLWLEYLFFGLTPFFYHLTNILLIASTAALVVILIRLYTGDTPLAALSGVLYALHPYHVENTAWISARSDPLYAVFYLGAAVAHHRWLANGSRGLPLATMLLFQAALFSKETALTLPAFLTLMGLLHQFRGLRLRSWMRSYLLLWIQLGLHFLLRFLALGGAGRTLADGSVGTWAKNGLAYAAAALIPAPTEVLTASPAFWGIVATVISGLMILLAFIRNGRIPPPAVGATIAFAILLGPSVVGLQERYILLPSAASALILASLIRSLRGHIRAIISTGLIVFWLFMLQIHWGNWRQAAEASDLLIADLTELSRRPEIQEIVVANMPFQVRGGSVAGDLRAALALRGERPVNVRAACYVSYATADTDVLNGPLEHSIDREPSFTEVRLRIPIETYSRVIGPTPPPGERFLETSIAWLRFEDEGRIRIQIKPGPEDQRIAVVWSGGRLQPLF